MSERISLAAELRSDVGKGASRRLRRNGDKVPAIIYGAEAEPQNLTLSVNELTKAMQNEEFFSQILTVVVDGNTQEAVVRDLQRNPANERVLHIDFQRVSADRPVRLSIPVHFINEENCIGVKIGGGNIAHNLIEVEVSGLPATLPSFIEVDMENVEAGNSVRLSDLVLPEGVSVVALSYGADRDIPVASVIARRGGASGAEDEGGAEEEAASGDAEEAGGEE